jgi:S-adenosylhomocysteine hydrolase
MAADANASDASSAGHHGHDESSVVICGFGELGQGLANMLESPLAVCSFAILCW